jgi:hypothetical protein
MKRLTEKCTRVLWIIFTGLLIASSLPSSGGNTTQSAAALQPIAEVPQTATPATPAARAFFEPTRVAPSGAQPFVTILCRFAGADETWLEVSDFEKLLFGEAGLDAYWREASYGRINLAGSKVVGWYTLPQPASFYRDETGADVDLDRLAGDCTAAADADIHFPDYFGIGMAFNLGLNVWSRGGKVCLNLDGQTNCYGAFWVWPANSRNRALVAHEMGHAFGLSHSTVASEEEFGDAWDVMSKDGQWWPDPHYNPAPQHLIAYDKDLLGCIPAHRKFVAAPEGKATITLERLAQPRADGYLMAQIPIDGSTERFYTVEARRRVGFDAHLPADAVVIHEVEAGREMPAVLVSRPDDGDCSTSESAWTVGMTFSDPAHGITISVDAETATGFEVTITSRPSR